MQPSHAIEVVTQLPRLKPRPADSNKGNFGRVLIVAGSRGMSGAAVLCGSAALRGGAGLVYVAVPESIQPVVASGNPCYLTEPLAEDQQGRVAATSEPTVTDLAKKMNAVAFGPGLGQHRGTVEVALSLTSHCAVPLVIDADGLNALAEHTDRLHRDRMAAPRILTPHPGEFARLLGCDIPHVQANRRELAVKFAAEHGVVLVLKGSGTLVTDGKRVYVNSTGNPGMATGGTGDVLTGLIAALLGQGLPAFEGAAGCVLARFGGGFGARRNWGNVVDCERFADVSAESTPGARISASDSGNGTATRNRKRFGFRFPLHSVFLLFFFRVFRVFRGFSLLPPQLISLPLRRLHKLHEVLLAVAVVLLALLSPAPPRRISTPGFPVSQIAWLPSR